MHCAQYKHFDVFYPERSRGTQCKQKGFAVIWIFLIGTVLILLVPTPSYKELPQCVMTSIPSVPGCFKKEWSLEKPVLYRLIPLSKPNLVVPPSLTPTPTPTPQTDETVNWKTYTEGLFEFRYPANFTYKECLGTAFDLIDLVNDSSAYCAEITFPEGSYAIYLSAENNAETIEEAIKAIPLSRDNHPLVSTKLIFNNNEFIKVKRLFTDGTYDSFYFIKDPKSSLILDFWLVHPRRTLPSGAVIDYEATLEKILSTFKFLDQNQVEILKERCVTYPKKEDVEKYKLQTEPKEYCATCGDSVCEYIESCLPSHPLSTDCAGGLYCPKDCNL